MTSAVRADDDRLVIGAQPERPPGTRRRWRAVLLILGALIGAWLLTSLTLGLALPRLDGGWIAPTLAVIGVIGGLALIVIAGVMLFRMLRLWALAVLVPVVLVLLVGVYSLSIALAAVYPPSPPAAVPPSDAEVVSMQTVDGVRLSGWYFPSRNGAAVVLRHGAQSEASDTLTQAMILSEAGYGVLATDARGHGASEGRPMELGWYGDLDIRAAVDYLAAREDVDADRIAVVGLSMGGEEAIGAAGSDERIRAVVAEGATGRTAADKRWLADEYGFAGVVQSSLDAPTYGLIDLLSPASPPPTLAESVDASDAPMLLIAAGNVPDEQSVAARLEAIDPQWVTVWVVPGSDHVGGARTAPENWEREVVGFLDGALGAGRDQP